MDIRISQSKSLHGTVTLPGDKSISHRSLMIASLAEGESEISGFLDAADPRSTLSCLQQLGVDITRGQNTIRVRGLGLHALRTPISSLDAGNSGTTIRLLSGILAGQPFKTTITGDESLRQRPMKRIIDPLGQMGALVSATAAQTAPLTINGTFPLRPIRYSMEKASAQVKSSILLAGLFADGTTEVYEKTLTRDHTERMLGLKVVRSHEGFTSSVEGGKRVEAQAYEIPGDISSAAFLMAAATLVPGSEVRLEGVGLNPTRTRVIDLFRSLGASIEVDRPRTIAGEPIGDLVVRSSRLEGHVSLHAQDVAELIDEIPIIATTLALSAVPLTVRGGGDLRNKESDRIHAVVANLRGLGVQVEEYPDGFAFETKNRLIPAECNSYNDHRIAMAFGVAGLALKGETLIRNADCVDISFPSFWSLLERLQHN